MPDSGEQSFSVSDVRDFVEDSFVPFANIERAITWPHVPGRFENDAEHSFSLALIGAALGEQLGMDPAKICLYATLHDFPELIAGDTSVWDEAGRQTKADREAAAIHNIETRFATTPVIHSTIEAYEAQEDEESKFVYALDKLLATLMVMADGGKFWKDNGVTFQMHLDKVEEVRPRISVHPQVLEWYDEIIEEIAAHKAELFTPDQQ